MSDKKHGVDDVNTYSQPVELEPYEELVARLQSAERELSRLKRWATEADIALGHIARFMTAYNTRHGEFDYSDE